jgi:hypothetical protein
MMEEPGFVFGNFEFTKTGTRAASVPTNVVPNLQQRAVKRATGSAHGHYAIVRREFVAS